MALGEKLFEETGKVTSVSVESVHPVEGVKMKVSFMSEIKGAKFPSGRNMGSGKVRQYPHGIVDGEYHGVVTTDAGDQFYWWAHEKSKVGQDGKMRGLVTVTGFTHAEKIAWANHTIIAIESVMDPEKQEFRGTGYEWK
jgi:hypothetical protein